MLTFQQIILKLQDYWDAQGCALLQPYDMEVGAGTSHTATFLRAIGPEPWRAAYVQPSRRPKDGRYGNNPNRLQHYYQYQVVLKPAPENILDLYLGSLEALGLDLKQNDVRFVEDDWENPTLGAWGLGWEVWLNGMEVTQFTYFQQVGGLDCKPVLGEITYGIERLAMYLQGVENVYDLTWTEWEERGVRKTLSYGDVFHQNEVEQSTYNFEYSNAEFLFSLFNNVRSRSQAPAGSAAGAAGLRNDPEGGAYLQPAGRPRRHFGDRTCRLHRPHSQLVAGGGAGVLRVARKAEFPDVRGRSRSRLGAAIPARAAMHAFPPVLFNPQKHQIPGSRGNDKNMNQTLLVELLTEELPPKALAKLGEAFAAGIFKGLQARDLLEDDSAFTAYATPRRLAVTITRVRATARDRALREKVLPVSVALDAERPAERAAGEETDGAGAADRCAGDQPGATGTGAGRQGRQLFLRLHRPGFAAATRPAADAGRSHRQAADSKIDELPAPKRQPRR